VNHKCGLAGASIEQFEKRRINSGDLKDSVTATDGRNSKKRFSSLSWAGSHRGWASGLESVEVFRRDNGLVKAGNDQIVSLQDRRDA